MLTILVLLMIAWVCVGAQFVIQRRREGRAESSVQFFRQQLSTLERATPGTTMRPSPDRSDSVVSLASAEPRRRVNSAKRRRRDVLIGLMGFTGFAMLTRLLISSALTNLLLLVSLTALIAYVWALRRLHLGTLARPRTMEQFASSDAQIGPVTGIVSAPESVSVRVGDHGAAFEGTERNSGTVYRPSSIAN